jgi:hypothetical protein
VLSAEDGAGYADATTQLVKYELRPSYVPVSGRYLLRPMTRPTRQPPGAYLLTERTPLKSDLGIACMAGPAERVIVR